jgi:SAM-dependent methyltransferase
VGRLATVVAVPDAIFADPRLVRVYDALDGDRGDLGMYVDLARELGARRVLDIGCGTGSLPILLAGGGIDVTGVDPAAASLDVAHEKDAAGLVTWILGDATTLPPVQVELAVMTGNVAQVFLTDEEWTATLQGIRNALEADGRLVFETRRPERRVWEEWARDTGPVIRDVPGIGEVEQCLEVTRVSLPYVSFRYTYRFARDGLVLASDSTLRFRSRDEIEESLAATGFTTREVRDAPDRPGREYVFVADCAP